MASLACRFLVILSLLLSFVIELALADDGDPLRQGADREGRQRDGHLPRRSGPRLPRVRLRRRDEVRHRPARHDR